MRRCQRFGLLSSDAIIFIDRRSPSQSTGKTISMPAAINFDHVSKKFILPQERKRPGPQTWLERLRQRQGWKEEFWALQDVSFALAHSESLGLMGINGSGKSTILKLIVNILHPTSGSVRTHGRIAALLELGAGF